MNDVRRALEFSEREFRINRLLVHDQLKAAPGRVFLDRYGNLIELSKGGQMALREVFDDYLERIAFDPNDHLPVRFFPWHPVEGRKTSRSVVVDPRFSFGDPITSHRGIRTAVIADRFEAGETIEELASDYELEDAEIEDAILFERAA